MILERMKSEDDKKSQTGKSVNGEAMKQTLLSGIYTSEEVEGILNNMGLGYNADQASKKAKSLTENVKSVEFQDPRRLTTGNERLNDSQVGRIFFETLGSTIIQGGEPLVAVVKTNFPVSLFLDEVKSKMQDLEESILICESALVEVEEPNQRIMDMRHELDISEKEELLLLKCKGKFMSRTGGLSRGVTTRSQATAKVGSDDGIADVEVEVIEIWEDSNEKRSFEIELADYQRVASRTYKQKFLALHDAYVASRAEKAAALKEASVFRAEMQRQQVIEILVTEMQKQLNLIVQKLKHFLGSYPFIRDKLCQNVVVNGESIVQPFTNENLSGIYYLMYHEYNKITLGAFCDYLMSLLAETSSVEESNRSPQLPQQRMDKHLKVWLDLGLAEFMTTDHLFTVMLLRAYHPESKIRKDGVQRVLEHAYRLENDASLREVVGEYSNMPLYSELVRWINDIHLKSIQFSSPSVQNTNAPIRTLKSQPAYEKPRDLEQAAAATVSRPYETGKTSKTLASGVYENEITRDQKLFCSNGFLYVATIAPCSNCAHAPRCFQRQCPKCKFWGHREQECHQRPRSDQAGVAGKTS